MVRRCLKNNRSAIADRIWHHLRRSLVTKWPARPFRPSYCVFAWLRQSSSADAAGVEAWRQLRRARCQSLAEMTAATTYSTRRHNDAIHKSMSWLIVARLFDRGHSLYCSLIAMHMLCVSSASALLHCELWVKKQDTLLMSIISQNINRFLKCFHCIIQHKICYKISLRWGGVVGLYVNARVENAGVETSGADPRGGKCRSGKCGSIGIAGEDNAGVDLPYGMPNRYYTAIRS